MPSGLADRVRQVELSLRRDARQHEDAAWELTRDVDPADMAFDRERFAHNLKAASLRKAADLILDALAAEPAA